MYYRSLGPAILGYNLKWKQPRHTRRAHDLPSWNGVLPHEMDRELRAVDGALIVYVCTGEIWLRWYFILTPPIQNIKGGAVGYAGVGAEGVNAAPFLPW